MIWHMRLGVGVLHMKNSYNMLSRVHTNIGGWASAKVNKAMRTTKVIVAL